MSADELLSIDITVNGKTKELTFKSLTLVPLGILRKTRGDQTEQMWQVFEWALPPESLALLDELPGHQLEEILTRLNEASEADLGKSQGSSTSSKSTARRSKPTS